MKPGADSKKKMGDISLLNDKEKNSIADNYMHNYLQDLKDGEIEGTHVIATKLESPHLGPVLSRKLVDAGIHHNMIGFLNQCDSKMSDVLEVL